MVHVGYVIRKTDGIPAAWLSMPPFVLGVLTKPTFDPPCPSPGSVQLRAEYFGVPTRPSLEESCLGFGSRES